jgi:hypothetical protein
VPYRTVRGLVDRPRSWNGGAVAGELGPQRECADRSDQGLIDVGSRPSLITPLISSAIARSVADRSGPFTAEVGGSSPPRPAVLLNGHYRAIPYARSGVRLREADHQPLPGCLC